ncbi:4-hydroxy-tetrahydrodipicolinate synthase [Methylotenera sp.]|uniref:4-hydroxy-tetrahydrodipicolinate synthase n=1 Tax=Methylotenera sp. TaxID=2051956 RepID=UPI0027320FD2|nr:4-hydroxy-tetrahydrodipicolinate synthase [Methylotenera sp.]MDP1521761.1 4-hydroxy-tetrahydrodipicolinate synthase [Methylotenera sp.]MDP2070779.1 4-hydroxy-tetrahydrodipicolinate synthase [Methylotenera sp.]MDP3004740.1 4-hydroxy-tetrahydrodipicolinate synthase [Methylotenera sp.]MDP3307846.1 4-hydroxy-tetrahydrodipicolinate synthase [Methylotenera sp.]MDP3817606.1 4-hydroxy-tetrahydrodipicolinate synthase [Methylotenera sp.]
MLQGNFVAQGSLVAIVTPMFEDGRLDIPSLNALIDFHVAQGSDGIVIVGTTGESPTVDFDEHCLLIKTAVSQVNGRVPVIAGTGANSTKEAIALTQKAKELGVDACLLVAPYYNKPTQEGLYQHFIAIADAVDVPQILYNVPGRTGCDISNETTLRLAIHPNIVGIKDATGGIERGTDLILRAPKEFAVLSGDDATAMSLMLLGGKGVISVTANVAPKLMHEMCVAAVAGDAIKAREINAKLFQLHQKLFVEANPIPVKWVLAQMGLIKTGIRLPMVPLSVQYHDVLRGACKAASIL